MNLKTKYDVYILYKHLENIIFRNILFYLKFDETNELTFRILIFLLLLLNQNYSMYIRQILLIKSCTRKSSIEKKLNLN